MTHRFITSLRGLVFFGLPIFLIGLWLAPIAKTAPASQRAAIVATIEGLDSYALGNPITVKWNITGAAPPRPTLVDRREPGWPNKSNYSTVSEDRSLAMRGKRWIDDNRIEFFIVAIPETVRLKGDGFLVFPPGAQLPFGLNVDPDMLRVIYPLSLFESKNSATLTIRAFRAGAFRLTARHITATAAGQVRSNVVVLETNKELVDRQPTLVVQDLGNLPVPNESYLSPNGKERLDIFKGRFEVRNLETRGLIVAAAGEDPVFSTTGRFITYRTVEWIPKLLDTVARESLELWRKSGGLIAYFGESDQFLYYMADAGAIVLSSPFVDPAEVSFSGGTRPVDLGQATNLGVDCNACVVEPSELRIDTENAVVAISTERGFSRVLPLLYDDYPPLGDTSIGRDWKPSKYVGVQKYGFPITTTVLEGESFAARDFFRHFRPMESMAGRKAQGAKLGIGENVARELASEQRKVDLSARSISRLLNIDFGSVVFVLGRELSLDLQTQTGQKTESITSQEDVEKRVAGWLQSNSSASKFIMRRIGPDAFAWGDQLLISAVLLDEGQQMATYMVSTVCGLRCYRTKEEFCTGYSTSVAIANCWKVDGISRTEGRDGVDGIKEDAGDLKLASFGNGVVGLISRREGKIVLAPPTGESNLIEVNAINLGLVEVISVDWKNLRLSQKNTDGSVNVYSLATGNVILSGVSIDDEYVIYTPEGFYDSTPEGGHFAWRFFTGLGEHHAFNQFASRYYRPDIIRAILRGENPILPKLDIVPPPTVSFEAAAVPGEVGRYSVRTDVRGYSDLKRLRFFVDGVPVGEAALTGRSASISQTVSVPAGAHWISAVAYDANDFASLPKSAFVQERIGARPKGQMRFVGVGVDAYPGLPASSQLRFSKADAALLADSFRAEARKQYAGFDAVLLSDAQATGANVLAALERAVAQSQPDDMLIVSFAGHGLKGEDGAFYFATTETQSGKIAATALRWDRIAPILARAKGRVVVLLDACHSGAAAADAFVPNDAFVSGLAGRGGAGMVVLAAAKGRQVSIEDDAIGHGLFSYQIARALHADRASADQDKNGAIELDELYAYVKTAVSRQTSKNGAPPVQTPWLSHDEFVGQVPVM